MTQYHSVPDFSVPSSGIHQVTVEEVATQRGFDLAASVQFCHGTACVVPTVAELSRNPTHPIGSHPQ